MALDVLERAVDDGSAVPGVAYHEGVVFNDTLAKLLTCGNEVGEGTVDVFEACRHEMLPFGVGAGLPAGLGRRPNRSRVSCLLKWSAQTRGHARPDAIWALPDAVADLLPRLDAPTRLAAHLRAIHDVAWQVTDVIAEAFPALGFNREEVLFGAATHDFGKTIHVGELSQPGSAHEPAGYELLLAHGIDRRMARFARNHGTWTGPDLSTEDLLISLADKIWKGKRVQTLEDRIVEQLSDASGDSQWQVFMALDDILTGIASDTDARLAFQARFPITASGSMSS